MPPPMEYQDLPAKATLPTVFQESIDLDTSHEYIVHFFLI
jgi:hypothetical protein